MDGMKPADIIAVFLLLYTYFTRAVSDDQLTTAVVVWDGTSELTDTPYLADSTVSDGSGEITPPLFRSSQVSLGNTLSDDTGQVSTTPPSTESIQSQLTVSEGGSGEITTVNFADIITTSQQGSVAWSNAESTTLQTVVTTTPIPDYKTVNEEQVSLFTESTSVVETLLPSENVTVYKEGSTHSTTGTSVRTPHSQSTPGTSTSSHKGFMSSATTEMSSTTSSPFSTITETSTFSSSLPSTTSAQVTTTISDQSNISAPRDADTEIPSTAEVKTSSSQASTSIPNDSTQPQTTVYVTTRSTTAPYATTTLSPTTTSTDTSTSTSTAPTTEEEVKSTFPTVPTSTSTAATSTSTTTATTTPPLGLGDSCSDPSSCSHLPHATCQNICRCRPEFYQSSSVCKNATLVTPNDVTVMLMNSTTANVSWYIRDSSDVMRILVTVSPQVGQIFRTNNRSTQLLNLQYGTTYHVNVTSVTHSKESYSSETQFSTPPGQVTGIKVKVVGRNVTVEWEAPRQSNNDDITYRVFVKNNIINTTMTSISVVIGYDTCFNVSITAVTRVGEGPESRAIQDATHSGKPEAVRDLAVTGTMPKSTWLSWRRPAVSNGQIVSYFLNVSDETGITVITRNITCRNCRRPCDRNMEFQDDRIYGDDELNADDELFNKSISGLHPYTKYTVTVIPATINHIGQPGRVVFQTPEDIPVQPINITLKASERSVKVNWSIKGRPHGNTSYFVITRDMNGTKWNTSCNGFTCNVGGLTPFLNYTLLVVAVNSKGMTMSANRTFTTLEDTPGPVTDLTVHEPEDVREPRSLTVTWSPPHPREMHGIIRNYTVQSQTDCNMHTAGHHQTTDTRLQLTNIKPECQYKITVYASTRRGGGVDERRMFTTTAGAPRPTKLKPRKSDMAVGDPKRQVALSIPRDLLCDKSYGKIHVWGLKVLLTRDSNQRQIKRPYRGPRFEYIVPLRQIAINRSMTSAPCPPAATYVVVGDGSCDDEVCNRPLEPDTAYRFVVFVCTTTGCTESRPSQIFYTDREDSNTVIVGVVSGVVLIVLSSLLAAVLYKLWKKRKSVRPSVHFDPAVIELGMTKSSLVSECQKTRPVKLQNYADQVEYLHRDSNLGFSEEYKVLKQLSPKHPTKAAEQQACRTKNRYTNVLPFDHSRVKLLSQDDEEGSDYINANFTTGYTCKREYIAAQGPLPCTKDDFWRLIWEQRIGMVVMLTQCKERGRIKCEKYWPDNTDPVYFGDLIVQLRSESVLPDYVIRILDVKQGNKKRTVRHFHFLKWPDFGCPEKTWLLLNFVSAVRAHMPHHQEGPTLVHCSAGVGRTGTFIAVDYLLQEVKEHGEMDIFGLVLQMRENRPLMVQTENQYIYIHDCIRDALQEDTDEEGSADEEEEEEEEEPIYQNA